jgi:crotonobetainyl-CoA:carnitine CoA-transferase CaiB-like acyl-CoA transferase
VTVDLDSDEGRARVRHLASTADVFIESSRPGAMSRMGLGPDDLMSLNPELVYLSINGYGSHSPAAAEPAYDTVIQARSGLAARQGDSGRPEVVNQYLVDKITGTFAAQAVLAALLARADGSGGQHVEVPMMNAALYYLWPDVLCDQTFAGAEGRAGPLPASQLRLTATADGHLAFLALTPKELKALNRAIGRPDLNDDRDFNVVGLLDPNNRSRHNEIVDKQVSDWTTEEAVARLKREGVPCAAVADPDDVASDPHVAGSDALVAWDDPRVGPIRLARHPARFSATATVPMTTIPALGAHNETCTTST